MMLQFYAICRLVVVKAWRGNLLPGLVLVFLPLFYAAWAFENANPGFQTGFIADLGGSVMSLMAGILVIVSGFEHFFWAATQHTPWFFLSRPVDRTLFTAGRFVGFAMVLAFALLAAALMFSLLMFATEGHLFFHLFMTALMVFYEFAMLAAVFQLLAVFASRLLACGALLIVFVVGHNLDGIRSLFADSSAAAAVFEILAVLLPDLSVFRGGWFAGLQIVPLLTVSAYAVLQTAFYLLLTGGLLQRRDL